MPTCYYPPKWKRITHASVNLEDGCKRSVGLLHSACSSANPPSQWLNVQSALVIGGCTPASPCASLSITVFVLPFIPFCSLSLSFSLPLFVFSLSLSFSFSACLFYLSLSLYHGRNKHSSHVAQSNIHFVIKLSKKILGALWRPSELLELLVDLRVVCLLHHDREHNPLQEIRRNLMVLHRCSARLSGLSE